MRLAPAARNCTTKEFHGTIRKHGATLTNHTEVISLKAGPRFVDLEMKSMHEPKDKIVIVKLFSNIKGYHYECYRLTSRGQTTTAVYLTWFSERLLTSMQTQRRVDYRSGEMGAKPLHENH